MKHGQGMRLGSKFRGGGLVWDAIGRTTEKTCQATALGNSTEAALDVDFLALGALSPRRLVETRGQMRKTDK